MNELAFDGQNPDVGLLYNINDLARNSPGWLDHTVEFLGEYGLIAAMALLALWSWWRVARRQGDDAPSAVAGVLWSGLAAAIAVLLNIPVRGLVQRSRPYVDHPRLDLLIHGGSDFSFVSDRSALTMAVGVGLFMVNRRAGLTGIALAMLEGFTRVFVGVHYPTDVIGGFALGTATALLLAPLAMLLLGPLMTALGRTRAGALVRSAKPVRKPAVRGEPYPEPTTCDKDLAA
ncbi:phosphatase PAP2 family protein [Streptantibioticus ferralitis]|uniref:Phosphatase PAP2 family protein n=1 Tax=Streptantibioticus ferralitis TaxID=236510 RepID=A0ABT5Z640_9ACTN|nr:phosphatase PAP2 family protein [Streptantibioticus ferralitis]MDF2259302.1 phosphatase PAP2 family protein [Streptantibioticus ferralitis]